MKKINILIFLFIFFSYCVPAAEAKSITWNSGVLPPLSYYWSNIHSAWTTTKTTPAAVGCVSGGSTGCGFMTALTNANAAVTYKAKLINLDSGNEVLNGATVPVGTRLQVQQIPRVDSDISWFGIGYSSDSPYGRWVNSAGPRTDVGCQSGDYTGTVGMLMSEGTIDTFTLLNVNPPTPTRPVPIGNLSCNGSGVCTVTGSGPLTMTMNFPATYGKFYSRYKTKIWGKLTCGGNNVALRTFTAKSIDFGLGLYWYDIVPSSSDYIMNIPAQNIVFNVNATSPGNPPNPPVITGDNVGLIGASMTFDVKSEDPDGDNIRYFFDWNNDGVGDQWSGTWPSWVPSGTEESLSYSWSSIGNFTFQVLAQDENSNNSSWSQKTVNIINPSLTFTANPESVDFGEPSILTWSTTNADSCIGTGGNSWPGSKNILGDSESVYPYMTTTYYLSCSYLGGSIVINDELVVTTPAATITASPCTIPMGGSSCGSTVAWTTNNFLGTPNIYQGTTQFSSDVSQVGINKIVNPDNKTFTVKDSGGRFEDMAMSSVTCDSGSVWNGTVCLELPSVVVLANPAIVRSGKTADITVSIDAAYDLNCSIDGAVNNTITHLAGSHTYNYTTTPLTSAQTVKVDCVSSLWPSVIGGGEARVDVIPAVEEV